MNKIEAPEGMVVIKIPFQGFYESWYSQEIDSEEEQFAEYEADTRQEENGIPEDQRLTARDYRDILFDVTDYGLSYRKIAHSYVDAFSLYLKDELGIDLELKFESMSSPKYYNFETDRIFAYMPVNKIKYLRDLSDGLVLRKVIEERHLSRSGFISFYSADLAEWLELDDDELDHNHLETFLLAAMKSNGLKDDWEFDLYSMMCDGSFYSEWEAGVDWEKLEEKVAEKRAEKLETT